LQRINALVPAAFGVGREAIADCEIGGSVFRQRLRFCLSVVTQRDPRYFEAPERFDPDRWSESFVSQLPKYAYFPFGGGPRACIGNQFAMMEIVLALATIGQKFA